MMIKGAKRWPMLKGQRGLGDTMAALARASGVAAAAKCYERIIGRPCGCLQRQARLNRAVEYR